MTALPLTLLLALAGLDTPARNARPPAPSPAAASSEGGSTAADAAELSDAEVADRARTLLHTIDTPVPASRWQALGPRAVAALEEAARDGQELPTRRARAVGALTVIGGVRAQQVVADLAVTEAAPFVVRAAALRGAGHLLDAKALAAKLRPVLERSKRSVVRATAAEVLAAHAPTSTCDAVRAQADREDAKGRGQFQGALARCGGRR